MAPSIEFSVISGSNEDMIVACLDSLYSSIAGSGYDVTVTATCNTPGTGLSARLRARFPGIHTIENSSPRGFAANHNTVMAASRAQYVWLLNDDLVILPETVQMVTAFMESAESARVAVVSPRLLNTDGTLQPSTYGFPSMPQIMLAYSGLRETRMVDSMLGVVAPVIRGREGSSRFWNHDRTIDVDTFRGACMAVRMQAVHEVGLMVEIALVGGEEIEWHKRFHRHGWRVVFFSGASVIHHGSQSVASSSRNLYSEYLKGSLYYFRAESSKPIYLAFCSGLLAMFTVKKAFAWLRRDKSSVEAARRFNEVTWDTVKGSVNLLAD